MSSKLTLPIDIDAEVMDEATLARIMDMAPIITKWLDAVKAEAKRRVNTGKDVPGYHMAPGKRSRAWTSDEAAKEGMAAVGINDFYEEPKLKSVAAVEKDLPEAKADVLKKFWQWHPGTPSLKKADGPRANNAPSTMFTDQARVMDGNATPDW